MEVKFSKYHGAGNDFIFLDNREAEYRLNNFQRQKMCDRHFGIGADGLLEVRSSDRADFKLVYFNADGREGTLCGNGSRCAVVFALKIGIRHETVNCRNTAPQPETRETRIDNDCVEGNVQENEGSVSSEHGNSQILTFEASDGIHTGGISKRIATDSGSYSNVFYVDMKDVNLDQVRIYSSGDIFVYNGSPHHVTFLPSNVQGLDVVKQGREMRYRLYGQEGSNINFVSRSSRILNFHKNGTTSTEEVVEPAETHDKRTQDKPTMMSTTDCKYVMDESFQQDPDQEIQDAKIDSIVSTDEISDNCCLFVRTYERGVEDETMACGTGCVAAAIADYVRQTIESNYTKDDGKGDKVTLKDKVRASGDVLSVSKFRNQNGESTQINVIGGISNKTQMEKRTIKMPGGCLFVTFSVKDLLGSLSGDKVVFSDIQLSGPAEHVFDGVCVI